MQTRYWIPALVTLAGLLALSACGKGAGTAAPATTAATPATTGDGDGQGDAKVAGTDYNATASIPCAGYRQNPAGQCPAGVKRNAEGGMTIVEITWPDGGSRALFFDQSGTLVTANTAEADGSARFTPMAENQDGLITVTIGPERYEFPDVFLLGD